MDRAEPEGSDATTSTSEHVGVLTATVMESHRRLRQMCESAVAAHTHPQHSRGDYPETDTFLAVAARHVAGVSAALAPQVRHDLPDGDARAKDFIHQVRRLEVALCQTKARLYGEAHAIHRSWVEVWTDVRRELEQVLETEQRLVDELAAHLDRNASHELALRLHRAELHSPTRPHPYLPHLGVVGAVARRVAHTVDSFWDTTEGRMIPEPVHPHDHRKYGLLTHYLLADTDPDEGDAGVNHHRAG